MCVSSQEIPPAAELNISCCVLSHAGGLRPDTQQKLFTLQNEELYLVNYKTVAFFTDLAVVASLPLKIAKHGASACGTASLMVGLIAQFKSHLHT